MITQKQVKQNVFILVFGLVNFPRSWYENKAWSLYGSRIGFSDKSYL